MSNAQLVGQTYTVQPGDFLSAIAQKLYGDGSEQSWRKIYDANRAVIGADPTRLQAGMVLTIPGTQQSGGSSSSVIDRVIELTNNERRKAGVAPLRFNAQLTNAAQAHNNLMVQSNKLSHQFQGEPSFADRISQAGYRWLAVAENIADGQQTPEKVVSDWMNSPPHRQNILDAKYQEIGVGYGNSFWTQDFGKPQ